MPLHALQKDKHAINVANQIILPDKSSYQSTGPQASTKKPPSSVNHVASKPDKPDSSSDDEYLYVMSQDTSTSKIPTVCVKINKITIDMIIDTGASIDILDETAYKKVNHNGQITLQTITQFLYYKC